MDKIKRFRGETLTLATSVAFATVRGVPPGFNAVAIEVPSSTLEQIEVGFGPVIQRIYHYDDSNNTFMDLTDILSDRNTSNLANLSSFTTADYLYVGCSQRFRGVAIDLTLLNTTNSVATWSYPAQPGLSVSDTWTDTGDTDGTISSSKTLGVDGLVTWNLPANWHRTKVEGEDGYWVRMSVSVTLDSTVTMHQMNALFNNVVNADNESAEGLATILIRSKNDTASPYMFHFANGDVGSVEMSSASITSAANLTWYEFA